MQKQKPAPQSNNSLTEVSREELLRQLEFVCPGVAKREVVEQSSCFVFRGGFVYTFDDEIACRYKTSLPFEGAIASEPLLAILGKMKEDKIEVEVKDKEIVFIGKRKRAGLIMESEITLPIDKIVYPTEWITFAQSMLEAISLVQDSASSDQSKFTLTCIHITPKFVEACDNFQATRVKCKTGFSRNVLIRRDSAKHIPGLGMTEFGETADWIHFRNPDGLIFSCRRYEEDYQDLNGILSFEGVTSHPITIPKGLADAAEKCAVFSTENADDPKVVVTLESGKLQVKGIGIRGWFKESRKVTYTGPLMTFRIDPKMLIQLSKNYSDAIISEDRLKVVGPKWEFVASLVAPDESDDPTIRKTKNWHGEKGRQPKVNSDETPDSEGSE